MFHNNGSNNGNSINRYANASAYFLIYVDKQTLCNNPSLLDVTKATSAEADAIIPEQIKVPNWLS